MSWAERTFVCGMGLDENAIQILEEEESMQQEVTRYRVSALAGERDPLRVLDDYRRAHAVVREVIGDRPAQPHSLPVTITFGDVVVPVDMTQVSAECDRAPSAIDVEEAKVFAPVVGAVLAAVDCRLGNALEHTESNRAIVEKVALQVMRTADMRPHDISCHISHIVECYFQSRENLEKSGRLRRRAPRWLMKSLGFRESRVARD